MSYPGKRIVAKLASDVLQRSAGIGLGEDGGELVLGQS